MSQLHQQSESAARRQSLSMCPSGRRQPAAPRTHLPSLHSSCTAQCAAVPRRAHLSGRRHRALVQQRAATHPSAASLQHQVCTRRQSRVIQQTHLRGRRHRALVQQRAAEGPHILRRQQVVLRWQRQASAHRRLRRAPQDDDSEIMTVVILPRHLAPRCLVSGGGNRSNHKAMHEQ